MNIKPETNIFGWEIQFSGNAVELSQPKTGLLPNKNVIFDVCMIVNSTHLPTFHKNWWSNPSWTVTVVNYYLSYTNNIRKLDMLGAHVKTIVTLVDWFSCCWANNINNLSNGNRNDDKERWVVLMLVRRLENVMERWKYTSNNEALFRVQAWFELSMERL